MVLNRAVLVVLNAVDILIRALHLFADFPGLLGSFGVLGFNRVTSSCEMTIIACCISRGGRLHLSSELWIKTPPRNDGIYSRDGRLHSGQGLSSPGLIHAL